MRFKRNQMEAAISRVLEGSVKPSSELRTRLKRLLDRDRGLGRNKRSADPGRANFAFYGEDANWGRITCAAGYSGEDVAPEKMSLWFGGVHVFANGMPTSTR